jgi:hypothetical protein
VFNVCALFANNYVYCFFPGVDMPVPDHLFDLSLSIGRHCYGLNLATAVLLVQQDMEISRQNED